MAYISINETYRAWSERMRDHGTGSLPFCIAFCGVFSSGKTSIINRLLKSKLPTGINPVTKVVTRIRYGETPSYSFIIGNKQTYLSTEQIEDTITGKADLPDGCTEILIEWPSELLKNNVEIIDTPGYEDNSALEDMSRTAVMTADLILFCSNALMLGKQFEKEYLAELSKSHGNFCLLVNRVDSLNTEEDFTDVLTMAEFLMKDKSDALGHRYFATIGAGAYANLNGLDEFLLKLTANEQERSDIRASTNRCFTEYNRELLSDALSAELAEIEEALSEAQRKNRRSLEKLTREYEFRQLDFSKSIDDHSLHAQALIRDFESTVEKKFKQLTAPKLFSESATEVLQLELEALKGKLLSDATAIGVDAGNASRALTLDKRLKVPAPNAEERVTRDRVDRVFSTIGNFLNGNFEIDDGRSWVWLDYHTPAIKYVRRSVVEPMKECWQKVCESAKRAQKTQKPVNGEFEGEIEQLENRRHVLKTISAGFLKRMNSPETSKSGSDAQSTLRFMREQTHGYRDLLSLLSMPGAFVRMMDEQSAGLQELLGQADPSQPLSPETIRETIEPMFGKMCRAYVTLSNRPNNPQGADEILSHMMECLDEVYQTVMGREPLTASKLDEFSYL